MANEALIGEIADVVKKIEHPEIAATFHELGMVGQIEAAGDGILIEIRTPFPNIPIKDYLAGMIRSAIREVHPELPVSFNFTVMSDEVRGSFLSLARSRWKGEI